MAQAVVRGGNVDGQILAEWLFGISVPEENSESFFPALKALPQASKMIFPVAFRWSANCW